MVQLAHDGLELWYGTPDAPAPDGPTEDRQGVSVTVGVRPANPSNAVSEADMTSPLRTHRYGGPFRA